MRRALVSAGLVLAMLAFGVGVYQAAGHLRASRNEVHKPTEVDAPSLAGTVYVVQSGAIYRLQKGSFKQITAEQGWMQPSAAPDNQLVAVRQDRNYSDMYLLSDDGETLGQLTHDASKVSVESNHWVFYPRFSPDGVMLFYAFDPKDYYANYRVDLAILGSRIGPGGRAVIWTQPNPYTGGDVSPVPLRTGALVYTKYSIDPSSQVQSQIWVQRRAGSPGVALTAANLGCYQATVSPDETAIAMLCNKGSNQTSDLVVTTFDAQNLTLGAPVTLVSQQLVAGPTFSPDGKTIAFLGPVQPGGHFQLWTVAAAGGAPARSLTKDLDLDGESAPVWVAG